MYNHLPTSAMNFAYNKVSLRFSMVAIAIKLPKHTKINIITKKNLVMYEKDVPVWVAPLTCART